MNHTLRAALVAALVLGCAQAQKLSHVEWTLTAANAAAPGGKALIKAAGRIESGWHLYSGSTPAGIPTSFQAGPDSVVEGVRLLQPPPKRAFDKNFETDTETFDGEVVFLVEVTLKKDVAPGQVDLTMKARYQTCTETQCVASRWEGTAPLRVEAGAAEAAIPANYTEAKPPSAANPGSTTAAAGEQGLGAFLLVAFGLGLASIFTPCVFPMIPITMSYFFNRPSGGKSDGVMQAVIFCLGIIVLFSGMGLAATAILGPFGVVQLGSNPWVNGFISLLFIAFGMSLLGAFEITIPSAILTRLNQTSEKGGFVGTLLMGLTFSLASFACVGPFVGTLLAASVSGGGSRPLVGMVTFAAGLALPFFLLALFPSYLKRLPRSGGWMSRIKVVMGFVILAASLKYLASLDQVMRWNLLTRERFLAAWIVLFAMAGLYLLGFLRLEGVKPEEHLGIVRLLIGMGFVVFAISLFPGMTGAPLGDLDAFVPQAAASAQAGATGSGLVWMKDQYPEALAKARREGKLVFVNFTGYACANCHWMKANMFTRPEIAALMQGFVLVELYCDADDATSEANQKMELAMFQTIAQPYYAILDPDGKAIATFPGLTKNPSEFAAFLQKGRVAAPAAPAESVQAAGVSSVPAAAAPAAPVKTAGAPGATVPQVNKLDGAALEPAALAGKVVVVNFWATWCVPCIQEIPSFNKLHQEYSSKGVVVVGVSMDEEGLARVQPFLKKHHMEYTVALGKEALNEPYKLDQLPVTLVFDRAGKLVKRFEGFTAEEELVAAVGKAL
jgi:thiol:disulfide interchange protein